MTDRVLILDFGSQVTQLIARRLRESGVYCEIHPFSMGVDRLEVFAPKAVILSGGPASVNEQASPRRNDGAHGTPVGNRRSLRELENGQKSSPACGRP